MVTCQSLSVNSKQPFLPFCPKLLTGRPTYQVAHRMLNSQASSPSAEAPIVLWDESKKTANRLTASDFAQASAFLIKLKVTVHYAKKLVKKTKPQASTKRLIYQPQHGTQEETQEQLPFLTGHAEKRRPSSG